MASAVALRDGSRVRIRQGRRSDGELVLRAFDDLSLRYLTEVDHHDQQSARLGSTCARRTAPRAALHGVVVPRAIEPPRQALAQTRKCPAELAPVSQ